MADEKPIHIPREGYPQAIYPAVISEVSRRVEVDPEGDTIHLLDYWHVLLARRWTVIALFATVLGVTTIATFKQTPIYQATTTIQIDRENANVLTFKDVYEIESATDDTLQTQYKILESRSLARRVIEELHLDKEPEFAPDNQGILNSYLTYFRGVLSSTESVDEAEPLRPIINAYLDRLGVNQVRQARLVQVTFESKDPKLAAKILKTHATQYRDQNFQFKWDATQYASEFLQQQANNLKAKLEKSEDALQAYSREKQILFTEDGHNTAMEKLQNLEDEHTKAQADLVQKQSYDTLVRDGHQGALPQLLNNQVIANLVPKLADLQKEESQLAVTFAADYPGRKRIRSQIEEYEKTISEERQRIVDTVRAEYSAALERERVLSGYLQDQRKVVNHINEEIIYYNILKGEADSNKKLYDTLLSRLNEASVSASLKASNTRVVDPAEVPNKPIRPRKALNISLGALLGLFFGIGFAFFQEYLDNSIKSPEDVKRYLNVPTLGTIPNLQSLTGSKSYGYGYVYGRRRKELEAAADPKAALELITHAAPSSLMSEAYRSMRTSLLLSSADHPPRVILITSAVPSEGKTVTAINTAISLTQAGGRVVLIDADMRKPRVHSVFSLGSVPGLSSFLAGSANLKDVIHETTVANLFVLPCGIIPPNPSELILSSRFKQLVQTLRQYFDNVVLDSPPLANVSDARILAASTDAAIVVVKAFSTSRHLAKRAVDHLVQARARNIGVILNDLDVHARTNYYSYYSGRYYYPSNYQTPPTA